MKKNQQPDIISSGDEEEYREHRRLEKESLENSEGISYLHPMNKFSKMLEDMIIEGDPYYLQRYRSIHNHELDTNLIENNNLINERDIHRPGA